MKKEREQRRPDAALSGQPMRRGDGHGGPGGPPRGPGGPPRGPGGPGGPRGIPGEKPKDFKGTMLRLAQYMRAYFPAMIVAIVCSIGSAVLSIIGPDMLSQITNMIKDGLLSGIDVPQVVSLCARLAVLYGASAILGYVQSFIMVSVTQLVSRRLRSDIDQKINRLPLRYFDGNSFGDVLSRVTNDVDTIAQTLNSTVASLFSSVTLFVGSIVMMFSNSVVLTLSAIGATVIGFLFMSIVISKSQKYFLRSQNYLGELNGHVEEMYSGHTVVKAYNAEKWAGDTFDEINDGLRDSMWKGQFLGGMMQPFMGFVGNLGYVAVCVVGAALTLSGKISFGVIVAFMVYIRLFTNPLSTFAQAANSLQSTAAAGERVFGFLDEPEMADESGKTRRLETCRGEVEFSHVHFGYTPDKTIIHDFSAVAKPGQKIAIVGPTGAGKTTIVNLLMRFYEVNSGEIRIDGVPTKELTRENVHALFCMVLQDTWLFEGTIRENLAYSKPDVTEEQNVRACQAVGIDHFVHTLPKGYDTVLDDSASLSAGQKQQLTIARAMIENAPLLILDEATSSVDTRTERAIQEAMDRLTEGRTSFVIAHRLSTIRNADLILVMRDGDIVESGNHEQLLAKGGFYAELYNAQFETAE